MLSALWLATALAAPPNLGHEAGPGGPDAASLASPSLNRGQWTDRVAIDLPPAPGGVVPELALVADPGVREGHLGSGWSLEIGGQVSRHQGDGVPTLGSTSVDEYRFNGTPLVVDNLRCYVPMWWDGSCFSHDAASNTWTQRHDGWTWTYGGADATWGPVGFSGLNETALWLLSEVESPTGQLIQYEYASGVTPDRFGGAAQSIPRPERIRYGAAEVEFEYETRPDRRVDASLGALGVWESRLTAIEVSLNGAFYARYTLEYHDEADYDGTDCSGGAVFPDPSPTQTLVRRVVREAASGERFGPGHKVLRCASTNNEGESWETHGDDLTQQLPRPLAAYAASQSLGANSSTWNRIHTLNLNGDGLPDLAIVGYFCVTTGSPESNDPDAVGLPSVTHCEAEAASYTNEELALPGMPHQPRFAPTAEPAATLNDLILTYGATGFAYALADIDRDGFTDLLSGGNDCFGGFGCEVTLTRFAGVYANTETVLSTLTGEQLSTAQLVEVDGDGFPDLLMPAHDDPHAPANLIPSTWIRNSGVEGAWFDAAPADLPLPLEESATGYVAPALWDTSRCVDTLPTEGAQSWHNPDAYRQSQAMFADLNNDGLVDVAYALYACWWDAGGESLPEPASAYSRIFYGDGRGGFFDSGLSAGQPWMTGVEAPEYAVPWQHLTASFAAALDVDRSGHMALLQSADGGVMGAYDRGLDLGFFPEFGEEPEDFDPGLSAIDTRYPWPAQAVFADFDGDGFVDQLRFEESLSDPADTASARTWSVTLHRAERTASQGRIVAMTGAWGGTTALDWTFTAMWDHNPALFTNNEVLRAEEGQYGRRIYQFSDGFHDGERFRGFGLAQVRDALGGVQSYGFSVSLPTMGAPVYVAKDRADGTLAELTVNVHGEATVNGGSVSWTLPTGVPYFAPLIRQCSFDVGPGAWSAASQQAQQSTDIDGLSTECLSWNLAVSPSLEEFVAGIGLLPWPEPGSVAARVAASVFGRADDDYPFTGASSGAMGVVSLEHQFDDPSEPPERAVVTPHDYPLPAAPEAPQPAGPAVTDRRMEVTEWAYNPDRSLNTLTRHRDSSTTDDDLITTFTWSGYDPTFVGWSLQDSQTVGHDGTPYEAIHRSNLLAGYFDLPQTIAQCGRSAGACLTTTIDYGATPTGEPVALTHPDGSAESWQRDPTCGPPTLHTDRVGRQRVLQYDNLCRLTLERFEGAKVKTWYDALHRVSRVLRDPDERDPADVREDIEVLRYDAPNAALREATLRDDGRLELRELDEWGRPTFFTVCEGELLSDGAPLCVGAEQLVSATLWAEDGSVYAEVDPTLDGLEDPVFHLFTPDSLGRIVAESHPGHTGGQAVSWHEHLPTEDRTTDPLGRVQVTEQGPLTTSIWTNGVFRGSTTVDPWGLTLSTTDADGRVIEIEYDAFNRPSIERLTSDPSLAPGDRGCVSRTSNTPAESDCTPEWTHSYDIVARTHTVTDPQGIVSVETFDAANRLTRRSEDGAVVQRLTWTNRSGATPAKVAQIDELGARTQSRFDGFGREIYASSVLGVATTTYTPDGWLAHEDEDGRVVYAERDVFGRVRAVCRTSGWDGSRCEAPLQEADYDGAGRVTWTADADGVETEVSFTPGGLPELVTRGPYVLLEREYDEVGRPTWSFQDGVDHHLTYNELDQAESLILGEIAAPTVQYTYGWSTGGRLESVSVWPVAAQTSTTTTTYNDFGWPRERIHADGSAESFSYDALGRLRFHEDEVGSVSRIQYDRRGRERERDLSGEALRTTTYRSNRSFGGVPSLLEITTTAQEGIVVVDYIDAAGRPIARVQPDGTTLRHHYDGAERWSTEHLSASGAPMAMTVTAYDDESGLPVSEWGWFDDPYAGSAPNRSDFAIPDPADSISTREYSPAGRLRALTSGEERTEFSYEQGYPAIESWDGARELYVLREDASPWVTGTIEVGSDGFSTRETSFHRDPAGRIATSTLTDPTGTLTLTREDLDAFGQPGTTRRSLGGSEQSREEWSYDVRGRPASRSTFVAGSPIAALGFGWDDDGALSSISGLQSGTLSYERSWWSNNDSLIDAVRVNGALVAEITGRDGELRPTDLALTGVYDLALAYDTMGRITDREVLSATEAFPAASWSGSFNGRGRLEQESTRTAEGEAWSLYDYAEPGWLTTATTSENAVESSRTFTHDAGGRRESSSLNAATEHSLGWDGSALVEVDGASLTLDPFDGVIEDDRGVLFTRDPSGALSGVEQDTETVTLVRDPNGWPILSNESAGTRTTTWLSGELPLEVAGADGSVALNLILGGIRLGQLRDGAPLGTFEDARGALLQIGSEILPNPGPFGEDAALPTRHDERFVFAGLEAIPGVDGLLLARHRELDTRTGAWLSPDPLALAGGAHRQRYAEGDPLGFVDPLGLTAGPAMGSFGGSTSSGGDRFNPGPIVGLASGTGGVWDPCATSPESCGGQQAGGRRLILHAEEDPDVEVDAAKSARSQRQDRRAAARVLRRFGEVQVGVGEVPDAGGSEGVAITLSGSWSGRGPGLSAARVRTALGAFRGRLSNARVGLRNALGGEDGLFGWWDRTFPDGLGQTALAGGWMPRRLFAYTAGRDATGVNYAADTLEGLPGLLRAGGFRVFADDAEGALASTGWVDGMRGWAANRYREGLDADPDWVTYGAVAGLAGAVLIDAAMPGPGGESKALAEVIEHTDDAAKAMARLGDEVAESGVEALARVSDDLADAGLRTDPTEVLERYAGRTAEKWTKPNAHHPIPMGLGGYENVAEEMLYPVETRYHKAFHSILNRELKARGLVPPQGINASRTEWQEYFAGNPGAQQEVYAAGLDAARAVDARFGTEFAVTMQRNIDAGLYYAF